MFNQWPPRAEWLEADGLGGFASGTVCGIRTRRYHALLLAAQTPPTGRVVLVNGVDAHLETPAGVTALSSHYYEPGVTAPEGFNNIESFEPEPWPRWTFRTADGALVEHEIFAVNGTSRVVLAWRLMNSCEQATLTIRPFLSGRDYHALHHENPSFNFEPRFEGDCIVWRPYEGLAEAAFHTNGDYRHDPQWYRRFLYEQERERGLDCVEDLGSPGVFTFDLTRGEAVIVLAAEQDNTVAREICPSPLALARSYRIAEERRRRRFASPVHRAADAYLVKRGEGRTIVAGYPWFTDWGRDTFIAIRGLCIAAGRLEEARSILVEWAGAVSEGMLPNRFPDRGEQPEFNSVDASLWYVIAVHDFLKEMKRARKRVLREDAEALRAAVEQILEGYARGTRFGIRVDEDGLLMCGVPGVQLTWMDAKVGNWVVTPRIGKPVEIEALWLNALRTSANFDSRWRALYDKGLESFRAKFWNEIGGYLHDVVDVEHEPGRVDALFRPNQILAVGGLPFPLIEGDRARRVVDAVESRLWTPMGLRSLAPGEPDYKPHYRGGVAERDGAYHQGTVWPWLLGPFVEAWTRARGETPETKEEARVLFLCPMLDHLNKFGLGHIAEVADADEPHAPGGCPFQAWSLGELFRLEQRVLANEIEVETGELNLTRSCI